jgi:murein DD-endopeptidase MepM/ murein hydrolase activator NlpD
LIVIDHGGGLTTRYGHLSEFDIEQGTPVGRGQFIGRVGSTGRSTGPHLHYEIRINDDPVNPLQYLMNSSKQ